MDTQTESRFWTKVRRGPDCWEWTGGFSADGYGRFTIGKRHYRAHRLAWEIVNGPIPAGLWALHRCDNPRCVRVDHLYLGNAAQNSRDMVERARIARGDRLPNGRKTHCPRGHEFPPDRKCRPCRAAATARWKDRNKPEYLARRREQRSTPEQRAKARSQQNARRARDPEAYRTYMREWYLKRRAASA